MADKKISELNTTTQIDGTELLLIVQGGANKKLQLSTLLSNLNTQTGSSFVVNQQRIASNFYVSPIASAARGDQTFLLFTSATGNLVGVGTSTPAAKLDVRDQWSDGTSVFESFIVNATDTASNTNNATRLASFKIGGNERVGINSAGDVISTGSVIATGNNQSTIGGLLRVNRSTGTNPANTNYMGGILHIQSPSGVGGGSGVTTTGANSYMRVDSYNTLNNGAAITSAYTVTTAEMQNAISFFLKNSAADFNITVPDGVEGQIKTFICTSSAGAGNARISPTNPWFNNKIQMGASGVALGRAVTLQFAQGKWACIGVSDATCTIVT
jgi:hypothetical protein